MCKLVFLFYEKIPIELLECLDDKKYSELIPDVMCVRELMLMLVE